MLMPSIFRQSQASVLVQKLPQCGVSIACCLSLKMTSVDLMQFTAEEQEAEDEDWKSDVKFYE